MKHIRYIFFISIIIPIIFSFTLGQTSSLKLPTTDNTSDFSVLDNSSTNLFTVLGDGAVGIKQSSPSATLEIGGVNGLLVTGTYSLGSTFSLGSGTRLHWYPRKAAFRVGQVTSTEWDNTNIGNYSFATGYNTKANGPYSFAAGYYTTSSGNYSFAVGDLTTSSGNYSVAAGYNTTSSGNYSFAVGNYTTASGSYSFSLGSLSTASGNNSTALGNFVSTNSNEGSFVIGDNSTVFTTSSSTTNQMMMRFAGGYIFYTNSGASSGVQLAASGSSWSSISDSTKKENYKKADGEYFLKSINKLRLGSWNYKVQNPKKYRHYGPMAQEIYHYFGNDGIGVIGVDTLLASADMDGIEMIALKALVKRTNELKVIQKKLKSKTDEIEKLKLIVNELQSNFNQLKRTIRIFINNGNPNVKSKLTMNK